MHRAGIIGCGRVGVEFEDCHARAYTECADTELVGFQDIIVQRAERGAWLYSIWRSSPDYYNAVFENYVNLARHCDIVSVCTPPETHCQIVCDISPYVKAIYCEKPIALTLKDADRMIEACHGQNTILQINHQRRFTSPTFRFSRGILNTGTHMFDLIQQLFGEVQAITKNYVFTTGGLSIKIEEIDVDEPVFELDCTHNKEPMILRGVEELVFCLNHGYWSCSSGEKARRALELALEYKGLVETA